MALPLSDIASVSVLRSLNQVNRRLESLLMALRDQDSADTELRALAQELIASVERSPDIALAAIFLKQVAGTYAVRHCTEAAVIVCVIARAMGMAPAEVLIISAAALTMNVGVVRQTDVFQGRDSALSPEERAQLRRHRSDSVELLRWAGVTDEKWLELVLRHHENDVGSGYPEGQLGSQISHNARLIGLADRYCAFVSARNYRRSLLPPVALESLTAENAMPADHAVMAHFEREIGAYPPGTLVRLEGGEMGVVSGRRNGLLGIPVHVLRGVDGRPLPLAELRMSSQAGCAIAEALHEDYAKLRFTMRDIWGDWASV